MNEDFEDILALLIDQDADFLIVGAHALAVHGVARATGDIDILVRPTRSIAERVCEAQRAFGAPLGLHRRRVLDGGVERTGHRVERGAE